MAAVAGDGIEVDEDMELEHSDQGWFSIFLANRYCAYQIYMQILA